VVCAQQRNAIHFQTPPAAVLLYCGNFVRPSRVSELEPLSSPAPP